MGYAEVELPEPSMPMQHFYIRLNWRVRLPAIFPTAACWSRVPLGPYGAALHNGGCCTGGYDCSYADLIRFHRERIDVVAQAMGDEVPDLLAFETFPSAGRGACRGGGAVAVAGTARLVQLFLS